MLPRGNRRIYALHKRKKILQSSIIILWELCMTKINGELKGSEMREETLREREKYQ